MNSNHKRSKEDLIFPDFDNIKVSTKTFTAMTNLKIETIELFNNLDITPYTVVTRKRGRKKKCEQVDPNKNIPEGSIITLKCEDKIRGVELKPKKPKENKKPTHFRNSITVVIVVDKVVTFKICRNGTFQMTGCKTHEHAELCVKYIWKYIKSNTNLYSFRRGDKLECLFIPCMRNIDFSLGFLVDREKLNHYLSPNNNLNKEFHCLLETSFGYTGVNIKIPLKEDIRKMKIKKMINEDGNWIYIDTYYQEYLDLLSQKDRDAKLKDTKYSTFLVFHSGKVIHSSITKEYMREPYYQFLSIMKSGFDYIEERLD
jgi:TATA-box binding protein (TBP) (component of TFIID and TFIIIB)